jgi:hypothetical protein
MRLTQSERASGARAKELIEHWLINAPIRRQCLEILAGSIEHARRSAPERWGVTLCPSGKETARLTVGMIYVCDLSDNRIALTLHGPSQAPGRLSNYLSPSNLADLQWCASGGRGPRPNAPRFPSTPDAVWCWFEAQDIAVVWPLVRDSYIHLIDLAAEKPLNPAVYRAHSRGIIEYLNAIFPGGMPRL